MLLFSIYLCVYESARSLTYWIYVCLYYISKIKTKNLRRLKINVEKKLLLESIYLLINIKNWSKFLNPPEISVPPDPKYCPVCTRRQVLSFREVMPEWFYRDFKDSGSPGIYNCIFIFCNCLNKSPLQQKFLKFQPKAQKPKSTCKNPVSGWERSESTRFKFKKWNYLDTKEDKLFQSLLNCH